MPKHKTAKEPTNKLHGQTLAAEETSKYLVVTLSNTLSWNMHEEKMIAKGNKTLGFVRRNLRECTVPAKTASNTTGLLRPVLEYASSVWSIHAIQNRGFRTGPKAGSQICPD